MAAYAEFIRPDGSTLRIDQTSDDIGFSEGLGISGRGISARLSLTSTISDAIDAVADTFVHAVQRSAARPDEL